MQVFHRAPEPQTEILSMTNKNPKNQKRHAMAKKNPKHRKRRGAASGKSGGNPLQDTGDSVL